MTGIPELLPALGGAGLLFFSIYQKYKEEKRRQARHDRYLKLVDKMERGDMPVNDDLIKKLLPNEEED